MSVQVTIPEGTRERAVLLQRECEEVAGRMLEHRVTTAAEFTRAEELLAELACRRSELMTQRNVSTQQLRDVVRLIELWYDPPIHAYDMAMNHLKRELDAMLPPVTSKEPS